MPDRCDQAFFARAPVPLARALLGCTLVRVLDDGSRLAGVIVETEAYLGITDRACHTFGGLRTPRNEVMWHHAGSFYVYFTYGMHYCCNIVCGPRTATNPRGGGVGQAVLIRALAPVDGVSAMQQARPTSRSRDLCRGPARLTKALSIDRPLNGEDLLTSQRLWIEPRTPATRPRSIVITPRIGIDNRGDARDKPLRFCIADDPHVSG